MTEEHPDVLEVAQRDGTRWLTLNRPHRRNALTPELVDALRTALSDAAADATTAVLVIRGNGESFCAGADLHHLHDVAVHGGDPGEFLRDVSDCFTCIEEFPKPVVAMVHGHCVAGGLELALVCDIVVASTGTLIGDGHARNGLIPAGGGSVRLPRRLPEPMARLLMLTGNLVPVEGLTPYGLPQIVVDRDGLESTVEEIAAGLSRGHRAAQRATKQLLNDLRSTAYRDAFEVENKAFDKYWAESDVRGPLAEFVAGRRPEPSRPT